MAVPEQTPYKEYDGNGVTKTFTLEFICESKDHLKVTIDGIVPELSAWSFNANTNSVTFSVAPAAGSKIVLQRNTPMSRTTNYQSTNNSMTPKVLNGDIDRVWLKLQELGVADMLLRIYVDRLHGEQKDYIDNKDQLVRNIISDLRNYVNQQDGLLSSDIDNLRTHVDRQNNNQNSYFENLINQQGVSLQQLDSYYKHLLQGIANIAAEKGWLASLVVDANGKNQQEINNNTAYFYTTVAQMIADIKLTDGVIVGTKGYHNIFDDGGAVYLISATSTDYSIPLANGLHAVFRDSFDIRKFGILDNATLDQTEELRRMIAYADSRVYEIDFLNFKIMTPNLEQAIKTGVYRFLKGMIFNKPHIIKNLHITHDKTKQLRYNTICIGFLPKTDGRGVFKLDNVTFDPYVSDFLLHPTSGDGDGSMHGFVAAWHGEFPVAWPDNQRFMTGYSIEYNNVNFISPAISYNLATNFWCERQRITNSKGEYWGLYLWHWCDDLYAENVHGVFRNDLHTGSGRLLVTNLFQEEQEVGTGGFVYKQSRQEFKNISSVKYTDGTPYAAVVRQNMGKPTLDTLILDDVRGEVRWYVAPPTELSSDVHINNLIIRNHRIGKTIFWCGVDKLKIYNSELQDYINSYNFTYNDVFFDNVAMPYACPFVGGAIVNKFHGINCTFSSVNGFLRNSNVKYGDILIEYPKVTKGWFFEGYATSLTVLGGNVLGTLSNFITIKDDGVTTIVPVTISGVTLLSGFYTGEKLISALGNKYIQATVTRNTFLGKPLITVGTGGSLRYSGNDSRAVSLTYDPPSIPANSAVTRDVTVPNAALGDGVLATFSVYNADIEITAVVSAANTVTVKFRNTGLGAVDLASGTLTVKLL